MTKYSYTMPPRSATTKPHSIYSETIAPFLQQEVEMNPVQGGVDLTGQMPFSRRLPLEVKAQEKKFAPDKRLTARPLLSIIHSTFANQPNGQNRYPQSGVW